MDSEQTVKGYLAVLENMALEIETLPLLKDNFAYLLRDANTNNVTVIDPSEAAPVIKFLESQGWNLELVICTHHHWDSCCAARWSLLKNTAVRSGASKVDLSRIEGCSRGLGRQ